MPCPVCPQGCRTWRTLKPSEFSTLLSDDLIMHVPVEPWALSVSYLVNLFCMDFGHGDIVTE